MSGLSLSGSLSLVKGVKAKSRGHPRPHGTVHVIASVIGIRSLGPAVTCCLTHLLACLFAWIRISTNLDIELVQGLHKLELRQFGEIFCDLFHQCGNQNSG